MYSDGWGYIPILETTYIRRQLASQDDIHRIMTYIRGQSKDYLHHKLTYFRWSDQEIIITLLGSWHFDKFPTSKCSKICTINAEFIAWETSIDLWSKYRENSSIFEVGWKIKVEERITAVGLVQNIQLYSRMTDRICSRTITISRRMRIKDWKMEICSRIGSEQFFLH